MGFSIMIFKTWRHDTEQQWDTHLLLQKITVIFSSAMSKSEPWGLDRNSSGSQAPRIRFHHDKLRFVRVALSDPRLSFIQNISLILIG